jgi:hypothetical protein
VDKPLSVELTISESFNSQNPNAVKWWPGTVRLAGFVFNSALTRSAAAGRAYMAFFESDLRELLQRVFESAQPPDRGRDGVGAFKHDKITLAAHRLERRGGGVERDAVVVGADERDGVAAGHPIAVSPSAIRTARRWLIRSEVARTPSGNYWTRSCAEAAADNTDDVLVLANARGYEAGVTATDTVLNVDCRFVPRPCTTAMMATTMPAAMSPCHAGASSRQTASPSIVADAVSIAGTVLRMSGYRCPVVAAARE